MPTGLLIARIGMTLIYLVFVISYVYSFILYLKDYDAINKRYWGKNKGKPDEMYATLFIVIILWTALVILIWTHTPEVWK